MGPSGPDLSHTSSPLSTCRGLSSSPTWMHRFSGCCIPQVQAWMSHSVPWVCQEYQRIFKVLEPKNPYCCYPHPCSSSGDLLETQSSSCHLCSRSVPYRNCRPKKSRTARPHLPLELCHTPAAIVFWHGAMTPPSAGSPHSFPMVHLSQKGGRSQETRGRKEVGLQSQVQRSGG